MTKLTKHDPEYWHKMTEERKPRAYYLELKNKNGHLHRLNEFRYMSDEMGELIGEYDVQHEGKLIPHIHVDHDPFERWEGQWDIDEIEDYRKLIDKDVWRRVPPEHKPTMAFMLKHQNPKIGLLNHKGLLAKNKHYTFTTGGVFRALTEHLKSLSWDYDKMWKIYGMAVPMGHKTIYAHFRDDNPTFWFNRDFGFGMKYKRTCYATYDKLVGKYIIPKAREEQGVGYYDKPVMATHSVAKMGQIYFRRGFTEQYLKDNIIVIRYHFYPLKSIKFSFEYNNMKSILAIREYRKGNTEIKDYNIHAFRYHQKYMKQLRKTI